ncbi:MAG: ABC transporter permease subunit [Aquiluna sp.]|nr:ABC transporter permease subunit [Aquiluna sp.]MCF8546182.1 ABC transporter permease subunit [Aquiluna sp.]
MNSQKFRLGIYYSVAFIYILVSVGGLVTAGLVSPISVIESFVNFGNLAWPIEFYAADAMLQALIDTLLLSILGTSIGFVGALGLAAALHVSESRILNLLIRLLTLIFRGIPDLVFALILTQIIGLGPFAGTLAIALGTIGVSTRTLSDMLEAGRLESEEKLRLAGTSRGQAFVAARIPFHFVEIASQFLFRLEINIRIATIIGVVGGGGLGLLLKLSLGSMDYSKTLGVIIVIAATVLIFEQLTRFIRSFLAQKSQGLSGSVFFWLTPLALFAFTAGVWSFWGSQSEFEVRLGPLEAMFASLSKPNFTEFAGPIAKGVFESLVMTLSGTAISFLIAVLLASVSSRIAMNAERFPGILRLLLAGFRSIPTIILGLILVSQLGLGLKSGIAAIAIGSSLYLARLISDYFDSNTSGTLNMLYLSGVNRLQAITLFLGAITKKRLIKFFFFSLDFNFRYSIVLGVVGAGGMGSVVNDALRVQDYETLFAVLILMVAFLTLLENIERLVLRGSKS